MKEEESPIELISKTSKNKSENLYFFNNSYELKIILNNFPFRL